ncbi:MAG: V-type ATPase 116kDa subunit family protein [Clostridia bacterium]|nr:V-type ATPase 116kDa subunit family protein [Clostridia bacterium]
MAIEKMKLIRVGGKMENLDDFIMSCCISGEFHPENAMNYLSDSLGYANLNEENPYTEYIQKIEEFASVAGIVLKDSVDENEIVIDRSESEYVKELTDHLTEVSESREELQKKVKEINDYVDKFRNFENLDIPIEEILNSEFLKFRFGCIPKDCYIKLKAYENSSDVLFVECGQDDHGYWGLYIAPETEIDKVDRIFASMYFERIRLPNESGTPKEIIAKQNEKLNEYNSMLKAIDAEISQYWSDNSEHCQSVYAQLKIASLAFDLRRYAAKDRDSDYYVYAGWVPQSSLKWFRKRISEIPDTEYTEQEPEEDTRNKPPVKLKNRKPFRPFEMFVEMYGLPSYGGIDITPFVAITYSLLFGIMFADVGQGLLLAIGGYLVYRLKGNGLAKLLVPCGICSMCCGFLTGSVFGYEELLDPLYKSIGLSGKPLPVMESINTILLFAIGIGIALVIVSMCLNVYCCFRSKKYGEAIFGHNGIAGILLYSVLVCAVITFMTKKTVLPTVVIIAVAAVCLIVLYFKEILIGLVEHKKDCMPEKWSDYIMQNFFEVIEYILTYFSNTVSFLRVGAFVLVHAGMMMVFSSLAGDPTSPAGIVAMVFGNIIVMALEGLLTGIQVLRLEFYEMFSRFYEGDGKPFKSVGRRKNRSMLLKIKNAFKTDEEKSDSGVVIDIKNNL